ncbi:Multidrug resistance-associated protein 4 [Stylophora pistillata]|uniref:Multidrug resistance-associated protein 4 n=1 Tax=Stylophora pistillata TaxID=50429 RepID=A0A2B4S1R4_STYPI|nr:Multidrug resistance-associated protein 4 [Stylophora pistillata]
MNNYHLYRNDRVQGGGGLMAYFSSVLPSKRLKQPKVFKTIEVLLIQSKFGSKDVIVMSIYRSPKGNGKNYYETLGRELYEIVSWISLQRQFFIIMGDLNLNKLRPGEKEGKILCNLEEAFGLQCLTKKPTKITENSSTLLDVILTNQPQVFREGGVYNAEISDHHMVYASLKERAVQHKTGILKVRNYKNLDEEKFKEDLETAPWQLDEGFESVDEQNKRGNSGDICLKVDDVLEVDQFKVTNHFAKFFSTMAEGIGGDHVNHCTESDFMNHNSLLNIFTNLYQKDLHENHFEICEFTCEELRKFMSDLNPNKSSGYDRVDPRILKVGAKDLAPSHAVVFNQAIRNGEWIAKFKRGEWIPVYKKDDKQRDIDYRPITMLPCVNKVYEVLLGQQVTYAGLALVNVIQTLSQTQYAVRKTSEVENYMTSVERVMTYTKLDQEPGCEEDRQPPKDWPWCGSIVFRDVSLTYYPGGPQVLKKINLCIKGGEKIAVAGGTESFVAALMRMPDADGDIIIEDVPIKETGLQQARRGISVLGQSPVLFSGSLRRNLDILDKFREAELWQALEDVQLKDFVERLEAKLDHELLEHGANFSVGERQLIYLVRVLLQRSKIVVLDEPTAHVDPDTEQTIWNVCVHVAFESALTTSRNFTSESRGALMRMPDADGDIIIEDVPIKETGLQQARRGISVLGQSPVLFSGSLRRNLDILDKFREAELWQALEDVQLKDFVERLEAKLDHELLEHGANFSVGERQLIYLVRVLLQRSKIVVLDEPTAHVDPDREQTLSNVVRDKLKESTVITIAHLLNTIRDCHKILVLKDGEVEGFYSNNEQ